MSDLIPLTAELVFKYVLGSRDSSKNLAAFLSAVQQYTKLRRVVGVNVRDVTLFPEIPQPHGCCLLRERENAEWVLTQHCILHYLELPNVGGAVGGRPLPVYPVLG